MIMCMRVMKQPVVSITGVSGADAAEDGTSISNNNYYRK